METFEIYCTCLLYNTILNYTDKNVIRFEFKNEDPYYINKMLKPFYILYKKSISYLYMADDVNESKISLSF